MTKLLGIKSVDFKITANGEGVVNWNGSFNLWNSAAGQSVNNHALPKMRGVDPMRLKNLHSPELENAKLFVSQNCIRSALFKNETMNLKSVDTSNVDRVICSLLGLVRGYVIADKSTSLSLKRKSALLLEDFVDSNTVLRYEQFSNAGQRNETSIFSKTNVDTTNYEAFGSISIEDLQFIVLEDSFNRSSYSDVITIAQGLEVEKNMNSFLDTLAMGKDKKPKAVFHKNYVRVGGITSDGEAGLLMNDDAIELVVQEILDRIGDLFIRQSKGYLNVTNLIVDYNDGQTMRIKRDLAAASAKNNNFAIYYKAKDMSEQEFISKMETMKKQKDEQKKKNAKKAKKENVIEDVITE